MSATWGSPVWLTVCPAQRENCWREVSARERWEILLHILQRTEKPLPRQLPAYDIITAGFEKPCSEGETAVFLNIPCVYMSMIFTLTCIRPLYELISLVFMPQHRHIYFVLLNTWPWTEKFLKLDFFFCGLLLLLLLSFYKAILAF